MFILGVIKACWTIYRRIYTGIQNLCLKLISVGTNQQQKKSKESSCYQDAFQPYGILLL